MADQSILPGFEATLPAEPRSFRDDPRQRFAVFYQAHLRFRVGQRVGATALMAAYDAWAVRERQSSISFKQLIPMMLALGHRRKTSDGKQYLDVALGDTWDDEADVRPLFASAEQPRNRRRSLAHGMPDVDRTIAQIDAALASLLDARRTIEALRASEQPHVAASRIVNRLAR